jgi:DNA-binding CsgD family transcriptional regulator
MPSGVEAEDDFGPWGIFEADALGADGNTPIGADLESGAHAPNIRPPRAARHGAQDRTFLQPSQIPGTLRGLAVAGVCLVQRSYGVRPKDIVQILIETDSPVSARRLVEVSVHLPRRGTRWVAAFRDATGRQVWRTTGLREREPALVLARRWEAGAKRQRAAHPAAPPKLTIRVRPSSAERQQGCLTQAEAAAIMRISERSVREIERRAFEKLRRHPALKELWREWTAGEVAEAVRRSPSEWTLTRAEIAAAYGLAETPVERQALRKLFAITQGRSPSRSSGRQV